MQGQMGALDLARGSTGTQLIRSWVYAKAGNGELP